MMNGKQAEPPELDRDLLAQAQAEARRTGHPYVRAEHLVLALLGQPENAAAQRLRAAGITYAAFAAQVARLNAPGCGAEVRLELAAGARRAVQAAGRLAVESQGPPDSLHLLRGIFQVSPLVRELLADAGLQSVEWLWLQE